MAEIERKQRVTDEYIQLEAGKKGYAAVEKALEVRGGPKKVRIGDQEKVLRKYHLKQKKLESVLAKWHATGVFVSPYCKSVTSDFLNALATLGLNEVHHCGKVMGAMRKLMSLPWRVKDGVTDWERFDKKPPRTDNGKTTPGKLETLARNLRRTLASGSPYPDGRKLEQIGCCVDIFIRNWEERKLHQDPAKAAAGETEVVAQRTVYFRLNTRTTKPKIVRIEDEVEIEAHPVNMKGKTMGPV